MGMRSARIVGLTVLVMLGGCDVVEERMREHDNAQTRQRQAERDQAAEEAAARLRAEEEQRIAQAKQQLIRNPSAFLESSDITYYDKGIINDYRQVTQMSILNRSKFAVTNVQGEVDWMDDDGRKVGSMPFSVRGSIPSGDTKLFTSQDGTLSNGAIQTRAKRVIVRFTHVTIVE